MKNPRRIQHFSGEHVSSNLTLERSGLHDFNNISSLIRGFLLNPDSYNGAISEGLVASKGTGNWDVDISFPAAAIQIRGDDVIWATDRNGGLASQTITLPAADPTLDRYDIIEARISQRNAFTDDIIYRLDSTTGNIGLKTVERDKEYYIELQSLQGTPSLTPTPPASTSASSAATVLSKVLTPTLNLTSKHLFHFAVGNETTEFVTVDLRAGAPDWSGVTLAYIVGKLNAAGFGTIASVTGGSEIQWQTIGTGGDQYVKFKELASVRNKDAIELFFTNLGPTDRQSVISGVAQWGYEFEQAGSDGWFKIAEILVQGGSSALSPVDIVPRALQSSWIADANTIENIYKAIDVNNAAAIIFTGVFGHTKTLWRNVVVPANSTTVTFGDWSIDDSASLTIPDTSDHYHYDDSWTDYVDQQDAIIQAQVTTNTADIATNTADIDSLEARATNLEKKGYDDTDTTADLAITGLPDSGPWLVTVHFYSPGTGGINIREGGSGGTIRGLAFLNNANGNIAGGAIISGTSFYIQVISPHERHLVTWQRFVDVV